MRFLALTSGFFSTDYRVIREEAGGSETMGGWGRVGVGGAASAETEGLRKSGLTPPPHAAWIQDGRV